MNNEFNAEVKRILKWGNWVVIFLAIFLLGQSISVFKSIDSVNPAYNSIQVTGKGEAVSIPDVATFSFTVSADAKTVSEAQTNVTKKMDDILKDVKNLGIAEKDIKTTDYSVWPKYTYVQMQCKENICPPSKQVPDGYTVNHSVLVKIRKVEDAGKALSIVGDKGATNVSGLNFTNDDPEKVIKEARANAIKNARSKAEDLAKSLGVRLVKVVGFYDAQNGYPVYGEAVPGVAMMKSTVEEAAPAPTLPTGENKVTSNVTVTYEIR